MEYTLCDLEAATNGFSVENKLGQGGYGTVYKVILIKLLIHKLIFIICARRLTGVFFRQGILPNGQIIAIKKLSKTFTQEIEEFKNEVKLTAKLQHVNLIRVMGFCVDGEEQILVYEYVQNKSLDLYLFGQYFKFNFCTLTCIFFFNTLLLIIDRIWCRSHQTISSRLEKARTNH